MGDSKAQSSPSATTKTLEEILNDFLIWHWEQFKTGKYEKLGHIPHSHKKQDEALAAINTYTTQAVIKELEAHISDLSYAVGYTDGQPFLKRQLELCKERLDELKGGIDE